MARGVSAVIIDAARESDDYKFVIVGSDLKPVYGPDGQLLRFVDGGEAHRYSTTLSKQTGGKYRPRPINDDKWTEREKERFASGEYQELPWSKERWWTALDHVHGLHFPHVSTKNSVGLMAYTENPEKGSADIQTAIKPGRYLEQFFKGSLNGMVIRDMCARFSEKFEENVILFARTEDEIEEVYTTGPASCMAHPAAQYTSHIHPVRVYAAGDLAVAYLKRDARIVARALVWPDKKVYNNIYGDSGRLQPLLGKQGYKAGVPVGARIQKVITYQDKKAMKGAKAYVVPHVDGGGWFEDAGEFLLLSQGGTGKHKKVFKSGGANGVTEWMGFRCESCGVDDLPASAVVKVVASNTDQSKQDCFCPSCVEKNAFKCPSSGYVVASKYGVKMWNGSMWWTKSFKEKGFVCDGTGLNYPSTDRVKVKGGKHFSRDHVSKQGGKTCTICGTGLLRPSDCDTACKRTNLMKRS